MINKTKWGDCSSCFATDTAVVKVAKDLFCTSCRNKQKVKVQIEKQKVRGLVTKESQQVGNSNAELKRWFEERRKEMTGVCSNCGGKSEKNNDKYFKFSIAHILPKSIFKSIATHESNWIELCHFGKSCHANLDNNSIDLIDLNCFSDVVDKFVIMYPSIAINEKRRIPAFLIEYLKTEI
jgi:hypothetical protein